MEKLARGIWSAQQILDALQGRTGSQEIQFRYDVIRGGARLKSVTAEGVVSLNRFADIQRTARFTLYDELDWLLDEIKPYMLLRMEDVITASSIDISTWDARDALGWTWDEWDARGLTWDELDSGVIGSTTREKQFAEFPLGVFVLSTPTRESINAVTVWHVEAYDHTVILAEDSLDEPLFIAAGTPYIDAVQSVLVGAGIVDIMIADYVDTDLPTDREFEVGTKKQAVVNALLSEINFDPIYCDAEGRFVLSAYKEPSLSAVDFTYRADELSVIARDTTSEADFYNVPNVFIAVCANPELDEDYRTVWVNDSPLSRLSTIRRGRRIVSEIYQPDAIASQEDLDAYIRRIAFEQNQIYEQLTFYTALMPIHGRAEVLAINHPDVDGVFVETGWDLPMTHSEQMTHYTRRLVEI